MARWKDFWGVLGGILGAGLGTGGIVLAGYTFYVPFESTLEDLGTENPTDTTSAMTSEGSVGDGLSDLSVIPGDITSENPVGGTAIGVLSSGAAYSSTIGSEDPMWEVLIFWRKDETPYSSVEKRAALLYQKIHNDCADCYRFPAIVVDGEGDFLNASSFFDGAASPGKMQETLGIAETVLTRILEQ